MKYILAIALFLFMLNYLTSANSNLNEPTFCEWLGGAARLIAKNRDNGLSEDELIGKYLKSSVSYGEQSVIISMIDRIYDLRKTLTPTEISQIERHHCDMAISAYVN